MQSIWKNYRNLFVCMCDGEGKRTNWKIHTHLKTNPIKKNIFAGCFLVDFWECARCAHNRAFWTNLYLPLLYLCYMLLPLCVAARFFYCFCCSSSFSFFFLFFHSAKTANYRLWILWAKNELANSTIWSKKNKNKTKSSQIKKNRFHLLTHFTQSLNHSLIC